MKLTDYKRAKIMRVALNEILSKLTGIEEDDLSTAERQIIAVANRALREEKGQ